MNIYEQKLDPSNTDSVNNEEFAAPDWEDIGPVSHEETSLEHAVFNFLQDWNATNLGQFTWLTLVIAPHIMLVVNQMTGTMHRFVDLDGIS